MARKIKPRHLARKEEETRKVQKAPRFNQRGFSDNANFMYPLNPSNLKGIRDALNFGCTSITRIIEEEPVNSKVTISLKISVNTATEELSAFIDECANLLKAQNQFAAIGAQPSSGHIALFSYEGTVYQVTDLHLDEDRDTYNLRDLREVTTRIDRVQIIRVEGVAIPDIVKVKRGL